MSDVPCRIRPLISADKPFVATTLTRSISDCPGFLWVPGGIARRILASRVEAWLKSYAFVVAAAECDDGEILGFMGYGSSATDGHPTYVLYCYVKEGVRRMGVGRDLLTCGGKYPVPVDLNALHWTRHCEALCQKYRGLIYRPTLLRDRTRKEEQKSMRPPPEVAHAAPLKPYASSTP